MKMLISYAAAAIAAILVATTIAGYPLLAQTAIAGLYEGSTGGNNAATMNDTGTASSGGARVEVAAGSNATVQYYTFTPATVEINAGESVTWSSPAELSDIHTVTFVLDQNLMSDLILPFSVPDRTTANDFKLQPPFNVGEPLITKTPDGRDAIIAVNKDVFYPTVIADGDKTTFLNGTDIKYTMDGTEKAINSGIIQPPFPPMIAEQGGGKENGTSTTGATNDASATAEQQGGGGATAPTEGPPFPPVSSFTLTFEEPGRYPYFCAVHPWMSGEVVVRGDNSTGATP